VTAALQPKCTNMPPGALRIDSSCAEAVIELGVMYTNEGKGDDAIALYAPYYAPYYGTARAIA
jgi:hypothetical protein